MGKKVWKVFLLFCASIMVGAGAYGVTGTLWIIGLCISGFVLAFMIEASFVTAITFGFAVGVVMMMIIGKWMLMIGLVLIVVLIAQAIVKRNKGGSNDSSDTVSSK